eukprot:scaffold33786_cov124-Isochrysis_galbana.AAC.1
MGVARRFWNLWAPDSGLDNSSSPLVPRMGRPGGSQSATDAIWTILNTTSAELLNGQIYFPPAGRKSRRLITGGTGMRPHSPPLAPLRCWSLRHAES